MELKLLHSSGKIAKHSAYYSICVGPLPDGRANCSSEAGEIERRWRGIKTAADRQTGREWDWSQPNASFSLSDGRMDGRTD